MPHRFCPCALHHFLGVQRCLYLAALLLLGGAVPGPAAAQTLTLTLQQASLPQAFRYLEAATPYRFVYVREDLRGTRLVSLSVENAPLDSVLQLLFAGQPLRYRRLDTFIVVHRKPATPPLPVPHYRGQVLSETGEPVEGASLRVRGSGTGAVADRAGAFMLPAPPGSRLIVSAVGYESSEVTVKGSRTTITLRRVTPVLDETVVIGYGHTTRRKATGSVGKVAGRVLWNGPAAASPLAALQGRVPGLWLQAGSGLPDAPLSVRLRGQHSLQSGTAPLFLVDGVPLLLEGAPLSARSPLTALSPLDLLQGAAIESVEVLRDADATAIYGSRGAGGVVLVTTRSPASASGRLDVSLGHGWRWAGRTMDYLSTPRYRALRREAFSNDGALPTRTSAPDLVAWDTARDQQWKRRLIGGTAPVLQAGVRFGGARRTTAYGLDATYRREGSVYPGSFSTVRTAARTQATHKSDGGRLRLGGQLSAHSVRYRLPGQDLTAFVALPPNLYDPYDRWGRLQWSEGGAGAGNPLAPVHQPLRALLEQYSASGTVQYRLRPRLELSLLWGGHHAGFEEELRYPLSAQDPARPRRGSVTYGRKRGRLSVWEPQVRYTVASGGRTKGSLTAGATLQETAWKEMVLSAGGYSDDALLGSLAHAASLSAHNSEERYRYSGLYSRLSAEHRGRYLLSGTLRRDGSSRFGPGRQYGLFGAVGAGWIFSSEPWVRRALPALSYGKLRASWGTTGNDRIGDGAFRAQWSPLPYPYGGEAAWKADRLFNPDFGWEVTRKGEVALEVSFWEERVLVTVARYQHRTGNLILRAPLPAQTGFTTVVTNYAARVDNRGWEGEVALRSRAGRGLAWSGTAQLTVPRNRLSAFAGLEGSPYRTAYLLGRPVNHQRGYRYGGIDPLSGLYRFEEVSGDGLLDSRDQEYTGTRDPVCYGSLQGAFSYRGWTLSALVYGVRQRGLHPVYSSGVAPGDRLNMPRGVEDRWRPDRPAATYQRATQDVLGEAYFPATHLMAHSSAVLCDASFVRLQHLHLSYKKEQEKSALKGWQWYLSAQHLFTLTGYPGDPEVQSTSTLPLLRTVETGITLTF